jgi:tellurite resistance-related uncharacterized protein
MDPSRPDRIPRHACTTGSSPVFTAATVPASLRRRHTLAPGNWARLLVRSGSLTYVDLRDGQVTQLAAGQQRTIGPDEPHRVATDGPTDFLIEFYREGRWPWWRRALGRVAQPLLRWLGRRPPATAATSHSATDRERPR